MNKISMSSLVISAKKKFSHVGPRVEWYAVIFYYCITSHILPEDQNRCFIYFWSRRHLFDSLQVWLQVWGQAIWSPLCNPPNGWLYDQQSFCTFSACDNLTSTWNNGYIEGGVQKSKSGAIFEICSWMNQTCLMRCEASSTGGNTCLVL